MLRIDRTRFPFFLLFLILTTFIDINLVCPSVRSQRIIINSCHKFLFSTTFNIKQNFIITELEIPDGLAVNKYNGSNSDVNVSISMFQCFNVSFLFSFEIFIYLHFSIVYEGHFILWSKMQLRCDAGFLKSNLVSDFTEWVSKLSSSLN